MTLTELLQWQRQGYSQYHVHRANLLLHIVAVPVFLLANVTLVGSLAQGRWLPTLLALGLMLASMAVQGRGHHQEPVPPAPFTGPGQFVLRLLLEQWVSFPEFVLTGRWWRALRQASRIPQRTR